MRGSLNSGYTLQIPIKYKTKRNTSGLRQHIFKLEMKLQLPPSKKKHKQVREKMERKKKRTEKKEVTTSLK